MKILVLKIIKLRELRPCKTFSQCSKCPLFWRGRSVKIYLDAGCRPQTAIGQKTIGDIFCIFSGGEVIPHQDGTFLYNEPLLLFGFWFPIDDATCTDKLLEFKCEDKTYPDDGWVAAPVKSGQVMPYQKYVPNTLILETNLQVCHNSERNTSDKPRLVVSCLLLIL